MGARASWVCWAAQLPPVVPSRAGGPRRSSVRPGSLSRPRPRAWPTVWSVVWPRAVPGRRSTRRHRGRSRPATETMWRRGALMASAGVAQLIAEAGLPPIRVQDLRHAAATLALASRGGAEGGAGDARALLHHDHRRHLHQRAAAGRPDRRAGSRGPGATARPGTAERMPLAGLPIERAADGAAELGARREPARHSRRPASTDPGATGQPADR